MVYDAQHTVQQCLHWPQSYKVSREKHLHIVTGVERLQVKLLAGLSRPQAQVDGVVRLEPRDGVVVRDRRHLNQ